MKSDKTLLKSNTIGSGVLIVLGVIAIIAMIIIDPIKQDSSYHNFCDSTTIMGVPNFWNVISNVPFIILGIYGLIRFKTIGKTNVQFVFFLFGIMLVGFGSGYYHFNPNSSSLVWDRLPMTIVFMSLISIIISEFFNQKTGRKLLVPLLLIGISSVLYWVQFDDLRFYAFVQFYPMLGIPIVLIFFKSQLGNKKAYWFLLLAYIMAKICEYFDVQILELTHLISGHSLKHFLAAVGLFVYVKGFTKRENKAVNIH